LRAHVLVYKNIKSAHSVHLTDSAIHELVIPGTIGAIKTEFGHSDVFSDLAFDQKDYVCYNTCLSTKWSMR
jgi:hypothetical protein